MAAAYNNDVDVEYAELNYIISIDSEPNDPLYPIQWALNNTGQMYPESGDYNPPPGTMDSDIDAPEAWDVYTGSSAIVVAVIDTGVDYTHRDLQGNMWTDPDGYYGYDFINGDSDPMDDNGHGTHCAGTIAAEGNNNLDIAGVCWDARIMALKSFGAGGSAPTSALVSAFYYAVENGADAMSNSWGGGAYSKTMEQAIAYAHSQGVIIVASAGNDNSTAIQYPAYYDHVIAVAATDSNDDKASFSNYGDWVDIAAPGVDILSLRADGTSMGTTYDDYTTIASGTSMACPHVAGAAALLLSIHPKIQVDELEQYLLESTDSIDPEICVSGRLNTHQAMLQIIAPQGRIELDSEAYSCSALIEIDLFDSDLQGQGIQQVTVETDGGDLETMLLTEIAVPGVFTGAISIASGIPDIEDGIIQAAHEQIITATYLDDDDGTGNPATATDTAVADCEGPVIFSVQIGVPGAEPAVSFETDEPAVVRVLCGLACGGPYIIEGSFSRLVTSQVVKLLGVSPETDYFFIVEATDAVGNETVDNNGGACYTFTTTSPGDDIYVPSQCSTIQEAIDNCWDWGETVWVADGTYTGFGNRDIDFRGKSITVRSENGPEGCIIDCDGSETEPHRGFYFHSGEPSSSIIDGFTITNGYGPQVLDEEYNWLAGGGIFCHNSSPTINNCIIHENSAYDIGGGMYNYKSSPTVTGCTFSKNSAHQGGGMCNYKSDLMLLNSRFVGNTAKYGGGISWTGWYSSATMTNCIFSGNSAVEGGGILNDAGVVTLINCAFSGNSALECGGMYNFDGASILMNCILWGNSDHDGVDESAQIDAEYGTLVVNYSCIQDVDSNDMSVYPGVGNIDDDPQLMDADGADNAFGTEDDNLRLSGGSPCIDAGDNLAVPPVVLTDLDGNPRFGDDPNTADTGNGTPPIVDLGAYEGPKYGFLLSTESVTVSEGGTATFTVALAIDPLETVEVMVTWESGDPDITVESGAMLTFDSGNYSDPQTVTLSALEDVDHFNDIALILVRATGLFSAGVTATEGDNEPYPNILLVDADAMGTEDGSSWPDAFTSLQDALSFAGDLVSSLAGFEIWVAEGIYKPDYGVGITPGNREATFQLINGVTIKGGYAGFAEPQPDARSVETYETILSGDLNGDDGPDFANNNENSYNVVYSRETDTTTVLDGLTITGGRSKEGYYGGGMYNVHGSPTVINCTFTRNAAWGGGGICNWLSKSTLINCTFSGNSAYVGAGIHNPSESDLKLIDCTFIGNTATDEGGAIFHGDLTLTNCTFRANSAEYGGALDCFGATLTNCTFTGNSAYYLGGGMYGTGTLINCTFSGNSAERNGGGMKSFNSTLINCILWGNSVKGGTDESAQIDSTDRPLVINHSCVQGWTGDLGGTGNIGDDPLFVDADGVDNVSGTEDDNLRLTASSPCINAGDNTAVPPSVLTDLDGNCRIIDGTVDLGAYEGPNQGFLLSTKSMIISEGQRATFTVALAMDPVVAVEVTVAVESGDPDITLESSGTLTFDSSNYLDPQTVTLAAAEDGDNLNGTAAIRVSMVGLFTAVVSATEVDNDPIPAVLHVDADAPGVNNGTSWAEAYTDLQVALSVASAYHQVEEVCVAQGQYRPGVPGDREATFQLINNVVIKGGYAGLGEPNPDARDVEAYKTILTGDLNGDDGPDFTNNGENSCHVVTGSGTDSTAVLDGFTVTGGYSTNRHSGGGGMLIGNYSSPTVINCTFSENSAYMGGGMYSQRSNTTLSNCTFRGNSAIHKGGGVYDLYGSPIVKDCTFTGNSAKSGGGIYWAEDKEFSPTMTNCTFSGNLAVKGGGMYNNRSDLTLTNCTLSSNLAVDSGGGMYNYRSSPTLANCILWGNTASSGGNEIALTRSSTIDVDYCDVEGAPAGIYDDGSGNTINWGSGNIDADPLFIDADGADNTLGTEDDNLRLLAGSPCIDAGDNSIVEPNSTDLDGNPRITNGIVDMGAYEALLPVEADVHIVPRVINRRGHMKRIIAIMRLPEGLGRHDVADEPFEFYADLEMDSIEAIWQRIIGGPNGARVFALFDKGEFMDIVTGIGRRELTVVGRLESGQYIYGSNTVRIIQSGRGRRRWRRRMAPN
ncbi:MAG: S8 family serine peptidase [Planctomycetota bacterium]